MVQALTILAALGAVWLNHWFESRRKRVEWLPDRRAALYPQVLASFADQINNLYFQRDRYGTDEQWLESRRWHAEMGVYASQYSMARHKFLMDRLKAAFEALPENREAEHTELQEYVGRLGLAFKEDLSTLPGRIKQWRNRRVKIDPESPMYQDGKWYS